MHILWKNSLKLLWGLCVVFTIPSKYSIYLVLNNILSIFFVNFDFGVFSIFISPDLCPKLAKHDFNRDEKRIKTEGCENIPTIFLKIRIEHVRYSIYSRTALYV